MNNHKVIILPANIEILAEENDSLKKAMTQKGVDFEFPCGGVGVCKRCKVRIIKSNGQEEDGLACQLKIKEDLVVEVPNREQKHEILAEGVERQVVLAPLVKKEYLELTPPSLADNRDDWNRLV